MIILNPSLTNWYLRNKRDLPWRETKNPYNIWVSEVILQQTRVNQGLNYYYNFIRKFPTIESLATAHIDELLKIWQGLGYYSRARNMHYAAQEIVDRYNGVFPKNYNELIKLKGIGDYTASAIASISFNLPTPVLDGNVYRFIARFLGISKTIYNTKGKKYFKSILENLIDKDDPGTFNQAIMEFGALQCIPKNPNCQNCPLIRNCFAYHNNMVSDLPVKKRKVTQKKRYLNYLYIMYKDYTFIEKRVKNDIWKFLYQLPLIESSKELSLPELLVHKDWTKTFSDLEPTIESNYHAKTHLLSHQKLITRFYKVTISNTNEYLNKNYLKIPLSEIYNYGIPRLIEQYLHDVKK